MNFLSSISQLVNEASNSFQGLNTNSPKTERKSLGGDDEEVKVRGSRRASFLLPPSGPGGSSRSGSLSPSQDAGLGVGLRPPSVSSTGSR